MLGMSPTDPHMELIRCWLRGETVNGHVGVRLRNGAWDGKTKIVQVDDEDRPPERLRVRRGGGNWHVYRLHAEAVVTSTWIYLYDGVDSAL